MKDRRFDKMGERLFDLEADPPKDGWKKIGSALNSKEQSGKIVQLLKHGWKPLIVIIPALFYVLYSYQTTNKPEQPAIPAKELVISESESLKKENIKSPQQPESEYAESKSSKSAYEENKKEVTKVLNNLSVVETPKTLKNSSLNNTQNNAQGLPGGESTSGKIPVGPLLKNDQGINSTSITAYEKESVNNVSEARPAQTIIVIDEKNNSNNAEVSLTPTDSIHEAKNDEMGIVQPAKNQTDSSSVKKIVPSAINEKPGTRWRITASYTPQYFGKVVKPVTNDEILITDIKNSASSPKLGFGFALGAGMAITPDFYLDAQLSYIKMHQDINLTYSIGDVDTLIAVKQLDESVIIQPVYQVTTRELSSTFGYVGLKLGTTYYFWSTPKRRFNLTANTGFYYLVDGDIREKNNYRWISLPSDNLSQSNFSFTISTGYSLRLNNGWELMINPALNYFVKKVKSDELPYLFDYRSFGLNIMLSKNLGGKI